MFISRSEVATTTASKYLMRLARHFSHKVEVTFDSQQASVQFPMGHCEMIAEDQQLRFILQAQDKQALAQMEHIIDAHLIRGANKEALTITWQQSEEGSDLV